MIAVFVFIFFLNDLFGAEINERILVCGVCRNVESRLISTKNIMESIGRLFDDYRILVYENNSIDKTAQILSSWAQSNPKVWVKSEILSQSFLEEFVVNRNQDRSLFVPEQIARARNIVLEEALSSKYEEYPYLIWMDMDFFLFPDLEGIIDTFRSPTEWDAVFAYGIDPTSTYWDWYAFRDQKYPLGSELLGMDWWFMDKRLALSKQDSWYPVYSAFGGCGIYKKSSIQGCRYSGLVTLDLETYLRNLLKDENHPQVRKYRHLNKGLLNIHQIDEPSPRLPPIYDPNIGITIHGGADSLIWRMSSFVFQYPSICEHVPFHASMAIRGHDKLYINPKLVFRYGN